MVPCAKLTFAKHSNMKITAQRRIRYMSFSFEKTETENATRRRRYPEVCDLSVTLSSPFGRLRSRLRLLKVANLAGCAQGLSVLRWNDSELDQLEKAHRHTYAIGDIVLGDVESILLACSGLD